MENNVRFRYTAGWKAFQLHLGKPDGFLEWVRMLWGCDVWLGPIPFMKAVVLANVVFWYLAKGL